VSAGKLKINSGVVIHIRCRSQVEQVSWDNTVTLIQDVKCGPGQKVVMNLLRRATVSEDKRDRILAAWGR
jgi:hypothetical protein